jgi:acyl-CoA reductase-like NAD-dependent aldehyde dehydrogenase
LSIQSHGIIAAGFLRRWTEQRTTGRSRANNPVGVGMSEVLIDGSWIPAQSRAELAVHNPATLRSLAVAPFCDAQDAVAAMGGARRALDPWRVLSRQARISLLVEVGHSLAQGAPAVAELQSLESGQPYRECLEAALAAAECFTQVADPDPCIPPESFEARARNAIAQPLLLDPDYPLLHWACTAVPLLEAGSTLVCAAPRSTPLAVLRAARCASALPKGVLNIVVASPETMRAALVGESLASGGTPAIGSHRGGVDAVFVCGHAELDRTLKGCASQRLFHCGQRPGQSARIYAEQRVSNDLADRLHEYVAFLECGDPRSPATDLGPLRSAAGLQGVEDQVAAALRRGALLKVGGRRYQPWGLRGYFFQPTVMIEGRGDERAPASEICGPVVIVSPVRSLAEALSMERIRRVSCLGGDFDARLRSLRADGIDFEVAAATTPLERIMQDFRGTGAGSLRIERGAGEGGSGYPPHASTRAG